MLSNPKQMWRMGTQLCQISRSCINDYSFILMSNVLFVMIISVTVTKMYSFSCRILFITKSHWRLTYLFWIRIQKCAILHNPNRIAKTHALPDEKWPGALSLKSKFEKVAKYLKNDFFYQFIKVETDAANNFIFKSLCVEGSPVTASYSNYRLYFTEGFIGHCVHSSLNTTTSVFQYLTAIWSRISSRIITVTS